MTMGEKFEAVAETTRLPEASARKGMFPLADWPTISVEGLLIVIWGGLWGRGEGDLP